MRQRVGDERAADAGGQFIKAAARDGEQIIETRQARAMRRAVRAGGSRHGAHGAVEPPAEVARPSPTSSERTGTAISAAPVGVGARRSEAKSISVVSVSWPTAEISGIVRRGRRAHDDFLVEAPEILQAAAAARDDQQIGPRDRRRPATAR